MPTTSYITPIMDRTYADVEYARIHQNDLVNKNIGAWNYIDINRICNNLKYAAEYMYEQGFLEEPYSMLVKTDWTETDVITTEQLNSMIIYNMNALHTYSRSDLEWHPVSSIINMNYTTANWIERNIHQLATQEPLPPNVFELTVNRGSGTGFYEVAEVVTIQANSAQTGEVFSHWSSEYIQYIANPRAAITTFEMPNANATVTANYTSTVAHTLAVTTNSGTTTDNLYMGQIKYIEADPAPQDKVFHHWEITPSKYEDNLYEPAASTHFTMPNENVTLTAVYITKGEKQLIVRNGNGSGWFEYDTYAPISSNKPINAVFTSWTGDTQYLTGPTSQEYNSVRIPDKNVITLEAHWTIPPVTGVNLSVANGAISPDNTQTGVYNQYNRVTVIANAAPAGKIFDKWVRNSGNSNITNDRSATTSVTVGSEDTVITATYRDLEYHTLTVITDSGTTVTTKERDEYFSVDAKPIPSGYTFDRWTGDTNTYNTPNIYAVFYPPDVVTGTYMGSSDRTITANYRPINQHTLTVRQLSGDVTYTKSEFETMSITAENAPTGKRFVRWTLSGPGRLSNDKTSTTTFTFGNGDATLTPVYVNIWTITVVGGTVNGSSSAVLEEGNTYVLKTRTLEAYERIRWLDNYWTWYNFEFSHN